MTNDTQNKPCPFCGETALTIAFPFRNKFQRCQIKCDNCEATGPLVERGASNMSDMALYMWNERHDHAQARKVEIAQMEKLREALDRIYHEADARDQMFIMTLARAALNADNRGGNGG